MLRFSYSLLCPLQPNRRNSSCKRISDNKCQQKLHKRCSFMGLRTSMRIQAYALEPTDSSSSSTDLLNSISWDSRGLVAVIVQHIDTGEILMQAYADRAALEETIRTRLATFYSRSRGGRWCKGETSGNYITVHKIFADCDKDSLIYLSDPLGPSCHTGARTCWFTELDIMENGQACMHGDTTHSRVPLTTILALENTIKERKNSAGKSAGVKPSWTERLLSDPKLLCKKVREEAGELCETLEKNEGKERAASEAADLLYHSLVLLNLQGVEFEDVMKVLRKRFGQSGIEEKLSRTPKPL